MFPVTAENSITYPPRPIPQRPPETLDCQLIKGETIGCYISHKTDRLLRILEPDTVSACSLGGYGIGPVRTESDNNVPLLEEKK